MKKFFNKMDKKYNNIYYCSGGTYGGLQVQYQTGEFHRIKDNKPIIFNNKITHNNPNIFYDSNTGVFTLKDTGLYYINWWVSPSSAPVVNNITLGIVTSDNQNIKSSSNIVTLNFSGNALLNVVKSPITFSLINQSGGDIFIDHVDVQGDLTILQLM